MSIVDSPCFDNIDSALMRHSGDVEAARHVDDSLGACPLTPDGVGSNPLASSGLRVFQLLYWNGEKFTDDVIQAPDTEAVKRYVQGLGFVFVWCEALKGVVQS